jgi:hypothetical protein
MDAAELENRFSFHPAATPERVQAHEAVRAIIREAASDLNDLLPEGRDKALVMTHLESAMFSANAAIARQPD